MWGASHQYDSSGELNLGSKGDRLEYYQQDLGKGNYDSNLR